MATQFQIPRWLSLVLSCLVVFGGMAVVGVIPNLRELTSKTDPIWPRNNSSASDATVYYPKFHSVSAQAAPPNHLPVAAGSHMARYDDLQVEVKPDGTLHVLGERMEMDAFRSLLGDQLREQLQTMVTIRPDDDCPFRHIGPVITVCEEAGVPHQTRPRQVRS